MTIKAVKVLEKRASDVTCEIRGRIVTLPLDDLWDDSADLVVGVECDLEVGLRWARANGFVEA